MQSRVHSVAYAWRQAPVAPKMLATASMVFLAAHSRASATMVCAGTSQMAAAHSGVLGVPSSPSPRMYCFHSSNP